jgi:RimJ/RimL family protein N-acetyltransferase
MLNLPTTSVTERSVLARRALASAAAAASVHAVPCRALPLFTGAGATVRELQVSDAPSLLAMLTTEEVARFISPPPTTVDGFERFILWTHREQAEGRYVCFGIVPVGFEHAVGLIQVRALDPQFGIGEWGFALGSQFWGTGVFVAATRLVLEYVFTAMPVFRLEARAVVENGRGNGALRKLGATCEALLRRSFVRNGKHADQRLWSIVREDWLAAHANSGMRVH